MISTGSGRLFGHGPGPSTIMSGPAEAFTIIDDPDANLAVLAPAAQQKQAPQKENA